jgi:hypothetical protein
MAHRHSLENPTAGASLGREKRRASSGSARVRCDWRRSTGVDVRARKSRETINSTGVMQWNRDDKPDAFAHLGLHLVLREEPTGRKRIEPAPGPSAGSCGGAGGGRRGCAVGGGREPMYVRMPTPRSSSLLIPLPGRPAHHSLPP